MPMAPGIFPQFKNLYLLAVAALIPLMPPQDLSNENLLGFKQLLWMRSLPYNSIIFDYVNLISIFLFSIYWSLIRKKVTIPLIFPFSIILFGSLLATCNSTVFITNLVTLAQDMYLFVLFVVLYNALDDQRALRYFVICWLVVATLEASLMLFQLSTNLSVRVAGTVGEANGAGGYLATSLFFVLNPYVNLGLLAKAIFCLLTIGGIFATKSLSATLGALVGSLVVFTSYWLRLGLVRRVKLGLVALAVAMTAVAVFPHVASVPNFLDRGPGSAEGRGVIWKAGLESFINNPLGIGIGPAGFQDQYTVAGGEWGTAKHTELHNDYIAYLVERGVIGLVGLMLLLGTLATKVFRCYRDARSENESLWAAGLGGMFCFTLIDALTHEVLHNRYVWVVFALIAAEHKLARDRRPSPEAANIASPARLALDSSRHKTC